MGILGLMLISLVCGAIGLFSWDKFVISLVKEKSHDWLKDNIGYPMGAVAAIVSFFSFALVIGLGLTDFEAGWTVVFVPIFIVCVCLLLRGVSLIVDGDGHSETEKEEEKCPKEEQ
ncbi:MAG: hypothetical protein LBL08_01885 [Candidatus Nomurabacteria bacterium]|nr:hypothetical protein [Candidatus Nomurabacteria bacterium]